MAFISATWLSTKNKISINVDQIVSVSVIGENTVIATTVRNQNGTPYTYYVTETFDEITNRIGRVQL